MAFDTNKPVKPSGDVLLPTAEDYDPNGFCPFRRVPAEERPYRNARFELGFRKGELIRNILWATWQSWEGRQPERERAQSWLDAQRTELFKWRERWTGKADIDRVLREVFYQVSASSSKFEIAAHDFAAKVLGF